MKYYNVAFRRGFNEPFYQERTFVFKSELELKKGDYVVVITKFGYQIGMVHSLNEALNNNAYEGSTPNIVSQLDGNYFEEMEKAKEVKNIERELEKRMKQFSKTLQYEALANHDNQAKELLDRLKELNSSKPLLSQAIEEEYDCPF